jgi:hypothetical protein
MVERNALQRRAEKTLANRGPMRLPKEMIVALAAVAWSCGGCVMTEKYEAEKARALNFQRLLAQEEKRTGELDSELKRVKPEHLEKYGTTIEEKVAA